MFSLIGLGLWVSTSLPHVEIIPHADRTSHDSLLSEVKEIVSPAGDSLQLIELGGDLYRRRCGACHSLDQNRVGPKHRNVYGRQAGSVEGFPYSNALRNLDVVWDGETLDAWLANPVAFAPGTSMGFRLTDAEERRAIIAYLRSLTTPSDPDDSQ